MISLFVNEDYFIYICNMNFKGDPIYLKDMKRLTQKEKNVSDVVDRYFRIKFKRCVRKITGIKIK